jgi:hypothetical protein
MVNRTRRRVFGAASLLLFLAISRTTNADTLTVAWDQHRHSRATRYVIHLGTAPWIHTTAYDVNAATGHVIPDTAPRQRYHVAVSAYNTSLICDLPPDKSHYSNAPPALTHPGDRASDVGHMATLQLVARDPYGEPVSYSTTSLPPRRTLLSSTGLTSGRAIALDTYVMTVTATDGVLSHAAPESVLTPMQRRGSVIT